MPAIVDYSIVLERLHATGLRCLYHNSGAFGFFPGTATHAAGWVGPDDPTIRREARALMHAVPPPYEANLAALAGKAWRTLFPGPLWLMPKSHWSYELEFGSREWLVPALQLAGIDPTLLAPRNNAAAIEFAEAEHRSFLSLAQTLLARLVGSDFTIAFPGRPVLCTLHHHKQLWWITSDAEIARQLEEQKRAHHGGTETRRAT